ncbi:hypothetical protein [Leifsonia sp. 21MFCrub1.1]|uniref:hypothetical protein n=1 Tax=Leifsonia sp. 21MFCrub1.1 TaxID=1798223 RepID=UPI000892A416|nr:hypothetical protein [Leifsonia sp. 21MFCrub1.1]SEA88412.1 hypothetical protein SAMN04515680_1973 [Leifsonia sp. 21MFCrub1.1]
MLNSVVDDPLAGDERGLMAIRLADDPRAKWGNTSVAIPGNVYEVGININNDAREGAQAAKGVHVRVEMPGVVRAATAISQTFVTSSNVSPRTIWDGITLVSADDGEYALRYVTGSAVLHNGGRANGLTLSDELFTSGTVVGCDALDGDLAAGSRCRSWITFRVKIDQPNFEVNASAGEPGTDVWSGTHVAAGGEQATVRVQYKNTGTTLQKDVVFKVDLPSNMHYLNGSGVLKNPWNDSLRLANDQNIATGIGINVGDYAPGQSVIVTFDVVLDGPPGDTGQKQTIEKFRAVETNNGTKNAALTFVWL